jgi:glycosyltransferase involved in cell wall biosynthesis
LKVDLVMWTKNGEKTLPLVLNRVNEVIPSEAINRKILVDDHSVDYTQDIADLFGWNIVFNEGKGISDGANTALKNVETEYFISFEQDLLLSRDWWSKIPPYLENPLVAGI